ncbi:MAG: hypothetical protein QG656_1889, partial [Candidatus Hydrogenedentes bacterium]|nr:hypothetical protein [Candidatus Hydrogenedentota bacterium]
NTLIAYWAFEGVVLLAGAAAWLRQRAA